MEQTELEVINTLLRVIGESPVNTIDLGHPDIIVALDIWNEYSSEIQSNGWWYNIETWQLQVDTDNKVPISPYAIAIAGANSFYILKGRFLYDLENHSYDFSAATDADLNIDILMEWSVDELPPVMFNYMLSVCKLRMLMDLAFDPNKASELKSEVQKRFFLVQKHNLRFMKPNRINAAAPQQMLIKQPTR